MPSIVGRESELGVVREFLAAPRGVLAIVGEPGIGKTTVWQEAVTLARAGDATVMTARPAEAEARLSFAALADLVAEVPEDVFKRLPAPQRDGLDAALLRAAAPRTPSRHLVASGFLSLVRALAERGRVLLMIDDLQWLDPPTATVLEFALRRLGEEPVSAVVSVRAQEAASSILPQLEHDTPVELLEIGPLSVAGLHRVLVDSLGRAYPRPTLVRIANASGGNPLYALEISRLLDRDDAPGDAAHVPVPTSLDALVRERIAALPPRTRTALLRASALARPNTRAVEAGDLAAAEEAGLVRIASDGRIHFSHPLFASAVYAAATAAQRRTTHRDLAAVAADPEERARHLALGHDESSEQVLEELAAAARQARLRGAPDSAAELTELALRFVASDRPAAQRLRLELAEHLYLASDFQRARAVLEGLLAEVKHGDLRAGALLVLAEIDYWKLGESAAVALAEEAFSTTTDPVLQARALIQVADKAGTVDLERARPAAQAALDLLAGREREAPALVAAALSARVRADLFAGRGFDAPAAERALELEASALAPLVDTRVAFKLGQWLRYVDDFDRARAQLDVVERQARDEGDDSSLANILLNRMILETWAGNWPAAAELTERMSDAFAQQGIEQAGGPWLAYVDAHAGRLEATRNAGGPEPSERVVTAIWHRCLGLAELAAGDIESAAGHLAAALVEWEAIGFREPAIWRVHGDAIEAAVAAGAVEQARTWVEQFERHAAASPIPWNVAVSARCRGLVSAADGELDAAAQALERSLQAHERCPMPFELARTLLVQGQLQRRSKRKRESRASLERAKELFEGLGAAAWIERADAELRRVAVRRAPEELSATEVRIARLAAAGRSNPEIAAEVFVSRKTVEANLARVYRKLGISSRAQLDRALREGDSVSS